MSPVNRRLYNSSFPFLLILLFLICNFLSLPAQKSIHNIKFNNISIKDGLSQSSPNCIFQDSRGIIWIGTEDGLNKYDGYSFTIYKPEPNKQYSISNSRILTIYEEDKTGNLWIGTNGGGLNKYDRYNDRFYNYQSKENDSLPIVGKVVHSIMQHAENELLIGTENGLSLFNIESNNFIDPLLVYPAISVLAGIQVNTLTSENNNIWIGTTHGLYVLDTKKKTLNRFANIPSENASIPGNNVMAILADRDHNLWLGTEKGLARKDPGSGLFKRFDFSTHAMNGNGGTIIKTLLQDDAGNIWIGTFGDGLYIWSAQTGKFTNYSYDHNNPYSLKNNEILSLYKDFSGIIWVGTNGIDIYNPKKEKFTLYDYVPYSQEKLVFRNIHPIYEDPYGVLWIGSKTDGIHILDRLNKTYKRLVNDPAVINGLSSSRIRAIKEYPKGVLWIGTEDRGLNKVYLDENRKPIRFKHYEYQVGNPNSITSNRIYAFFTDDSGRLWIGTDNGLTIMNIEAETFAQYLPDPANPNALSNSTVYAIYGDYAGNIWLATDFGVNKYDPATGGFVHYVHIEGDENSIIHNEILCFHEDTRGNLWIGTYGKGLDKFDPINNKFTHFTNIEQFSTAVIYGILEDETGCLWMSTNNGLLKFREKTGEINQFSIEDGLQSNEFNGTSFFKSPAGEMFFGGQYGFNSFYPNDVIVDSIPPKIILSDLQVRNVSVIPGENSPISKQINEAREIRLNYRQNNFTLYFSALHYANPALNHYKYKLEGFDDNWIDVGNKRFVSYTSLPYKTYTFRVIASNSDGVWNDEGLSVKIRIIPPFWSTIWFKVLLVIVLIWGMIYLLRKRLANAQQQKQLFEDKFEASSKELVEAQQQLEKQHAEIIIQKRELIQREKDQESLIWFNQGLGLFTDLISKNKDNLTQLCQVIIEKLVEYVGAQQGGIFLLSSEDENDRYLELIANYAFTGSKIHTQFSIGEGYVGTCFSNKKFIEVDNLTDDYAELKSGLGSVYLKHLILAPLMSNDRCAGVVELGSFNKIKGYRVSFVDKLMETLASTISTVQYNARLKKLIERSDLQANELKETEEQMRLNFEEIVAAQEESARREDDLIQLAEESATREEVLNQEIYLLKSKIEQLTGKPYEE